MILDAILGPTQSLAPAPSADFWYDGFGGRQTSAGVRVDENTAFNQSVCWAATRLLSGTTGWLPFNLYKRTPNGGANIASTHRVHRLIHDQPNDEMGAMMFRASAMNHQVNWGNAFAEIVRDGGGLPVRLEPIHPRRIPLRNIKRENGRLVYYVNRPDGIGLPERVLQENMFHVASIICDNGIFGEGVIAHARETIGKAMGTQQRGASALRNGGAPPLALKSKATSFKAREEMKEYRRQLQEEHGGPENAGKWLLLPPDAEVQMLGFSLEDSQFIESMQFDIEEIARWYGVPAHLVGHLLRATFNNIEELGIAFVQGLMPWFKTWEQEVWLKLLTKEEQPLYYAKFVVDAIQRGNLQTRTEAGVKKFFNGLWTLNDWAEQEDMNPVTETSVVDGNVVNLGDVRFVQQAMIPLASAAKGPAPAAASPDGAGPDIAGDLKLRMDAYGVGVRAGAITPQTDDEEQFRQEAGLPPMSAEAKAAWADDEGVRHPITLRDPNAAPATPFGQPKAPPEDEEPELSVTVAGLSSELESLRQQLVAKPHGLNGEAQELCDQLAAAKAAQKQLATAMLNDVMDRMVSIEINGVKRVAEKASKFDVRLREFYDKHKAVMERSLKEPLAAASNGEPGAFVAGHIAESIRQLDALCDCQADELAAKVGECVDKWHEERATVTM